MNNVLFVLLEMLLGALLFGFSAKNLSEKHYLMFGFDLMLAITAVINIVVHMNFR